MERNLAYAVDLIVELGLNEPEKGEPPKPDDFYALVVGSQSPDIPIGTRFLNPKFTDFLPAAKEEGEAPGQVGDSVKAQVKKALDVPRTWSDLQRKLERKGWDTEKAKALLLEEFGPFDAARLEEYWEYLDGLPEPASSAAEDEQPGA